jgi:hypothetical protein
MSRTTIATVVEGHGEVNALPVLLRRVAQELGVWDLDLPTPYRMTRSRLVRAGGTEAAVEAVAPRVASRGGVLVLLDADDDLPCRLGPELLSRARLARSDPPVSVVLARSEFESWFLAAATSLSGCRDLPDPLEGPGEAEAIRDAKGWLSDRMSGHPYKPAVDQAALAARFDLELARARSSSFDKFWRDASRLIAGHDPHS